MPVILAWLYNIKYIIPYIYQMFFSRECFDVDNKEKSEKTVEIGLTQSFVASIKVGKYRKLRLRGNTSQT